MNEHTNSYGACGDFTGIYLILNFTNLFKFNLTNLFKFFILPEVVQFFILPKLV